jgi:hypothetical protein
MLIRQMVRDPPAPANRHSQRESSKMVRYLLGASAAGGANAARLARDLRLPSWILQRDEVMICPDYALRLWELAEHALKVPDLAITFAERYQPGELDLYDYLFTTAPTLRDGFDISSRSCLSASRSGSGRRARTARSARLSAPPWSSSTRRPPSSRSARATWPSRCSARIRRWLGFSPAMPRRCTYPHTCVPVHTL